MKISALIAFLSIIAVSAKAQTDSLFDNSIFSRNHFTFNIQNGFTRGASEPVSGPLKLDPRTGYVYHANLNYTANFSDKIGATVGAGIGTFPFIFEIYQLDLGRMLYFEDVSYDPFVSLKAEINYRQKLNSKYFLNAFAGASAFSLRDYEISIGASTTSQPDYLYLVNINYQRGWKPLVHIGTGISRVLPNRDLLSLRIDYNHSFRDFYTGTYFIMPNTPDASKGRYFNRGNHLNLGLGYTFTRMEKTKKMQQNYLQGGRENIEADYKKEKRKIHENTTMLAISGGVTAPINHAEDANRMFSNAFIPNLMPYFSLEHNLKKNYYAEAGFGFQEYFSATKTKYEIGASGSNAFMAYQASFGGGKRLIGKHNNYNYLNITGGVVLNIIDNEIGHNGGSGSSIVNPNRDTVFKYSAEHYTVNRITPLFYIGASKDFRISGGFYLTMLYRYHQGFLNLYEQRITYTSVDLDGPQKATVSMNGSFHTFQLGVKFNLGNLPEKNLKRKLIPFEKGTTIISATPGLTYYQTRTKIQASDYNSSYKEALSAFSPAIGLEYYLSGKNYAEAKAAFHNYYGFTMGMKIANLALGAGRRLELANGFNLININGGISLSMLTGTSGTNENNIYHNYEEERDEYYSASYDKKEMKGTRTSMGISGNDTIYNSTTTFGIEKTLIPAFYLGVSKDFRITNKLSTGISYCRNIGLGKFYAEDTKTVNFTNGFFRNEKSSMSGTASQLIFSVKYRLK